MTQIQRRSSLTGSRTYKDCQDGHVMATLEGPELFENQIEEQPRYVTSEELARQLNVTVHAVRKWRSQGRITPYQFGRSVRYVVDEVVAALTRKGACRHAKQGR
jgi:excisionase family DNA binding protein